MSRRLGIDLGATRADFLLSGDAAHEAVALKLPIKQQGLTAAIASGASQLIYRAGVDAAEIANVAVALPPEIGDLIGSRIGLLVTRGFEQRLAQAGAAEQFMLTRGVAERVSASGNTLHQLDEDAARLSIGQLLGMQADAIAVCLLNAPRNPAHELQLGALISELNENIPVVLSHQISAGRGEEARTRAVLTAAFAAQNARRQISAVEKGLASAQISPAIDIVQSTGERTDAASAHDAPAGLLAAGLASGASAAARAAQATGHRHALSMNVGGSAALGALIRNGAARVANTTKTPIGEISMPSLDVREVGGGLRSVATTPIAGTIRVGPEQSTPACQGGGGTPTVMDALVAMRHIPAEKLSLDREAADAAIAGFAANIGTTPLRAAEGIVSVYAEAVAGALRLVAVERGEDPSKLALIAGGGAGALLGCAVADCIGATHVVVPANAGAMTAAGAATSGKGRQFAAAIAASADHSGDGGLARAISELREKAGNASVRYRADVRARRANFQVSLPFEVGDGPDGSAIAQHLQARATDAFRQRFGHPPKEAIEITAVRAMVTNEDHDTPAQSTVSARQGSSAPAAQQMQVWFDGGFKAASVIDGGMLVAGSHIAGPAIIVQSDTTISIAPGWTALVDSQMNVVINAEVSGRA